MQVSAKQKLVNQNLMIVTREICFIVKVIILMLSNVKSLIPVDKMDIRITFEKSKV